MVYNPTPADDLNKKLELLRENLRSLGSVAVGFSGGVDSALLLAVAHDMLGDRAIAVTVTAPFVPDRETEEAAAFCSARGIRQFICRVNPLQIDECRCNGPDRCYYCKRAIFSKILRVAGEQGISCAAEGSNMDDLGDYRPGLRAVAELSVRSPLRDAGLYKEEIRTIARTMGLPVWSKPAYACLASRFVYGEEITEEKLHMVDQAEQFLIRLGFTEERVRIHGKLARIEVPEKDIARIASEEIRSSICEAFFSFGFSHVSLDLRGYRTGSMNVTIHE